ncbi:hypothetical protein GN244_ATG14034 [Phytophthora infestans]|uniref:Uncharacterized protein n=1 Tax=Phytophthora infestans TaxID=4787 RepID=A0A833VYH3_PHYIN|nr:hypothetical protein GN244_ATG14034 [Phytophthora infestans]KAF4141602.1 hypothetical protein GN958_ATG09206 [Phytophthora infestans]
MDSDSETKQLAHGVAATGSDIPHAPFARENLRRIQAAQIVQPIQYTVQHSTETEQKLENSTLSVSQSGIKLFVIHLHCISNN